MARARFPRRYLGQKGGYLPWHNYDEGHFDEALYAKVGTEAFLEIAAKYKICTRCREVLCARMVRTPEGDLVPRPEFETAALFINCCITDREAIFYIRKLASELGIDAAAFANVAAGAMELQEKGFLRGWKGAPRFGDAGSLIQFLKDVAYRGNETGTIFSRPSPQCRPPAITGRTRPPRNPPR